MKLTANLNGFDTLIFDGVSNINFSGSTEGYMSTELQWFNAISFRTTTPDVHMDLIKSKYKLALERFDQHVRLTTEFQLYETNTTPKISIFFSPGSRGLLNPPDFRIED